MCILEQGSWGQNISRQHAAILQPQRDPVFLRGYALSEFIIQHTDADQQYNYNRESEFGRGEKNKVHRQNAG